MYGTLLVLIPDHGRVSYMWEKRNSQSRTWDPIDVPSYVCLLYVDGALVTTGALLEMNTISLLCCAEVSIYNYTHVPIIK